MSVSQSGFTVTNAAKERIKSALYLVFGAIISAIAINLFYTPLALTMGGVSGVASIIFQLTGRGDFLPFGILVGLLNIPLLILGWVRIGLRFVYRSIVGTFVYALILWLSEKPMRNWFREYINHQTINGSPDLLIFCLFGGIIFGISMGLILRGGFTTGGTDILAIVIHRRFPGISIGKLLMILDASVVVSTLFFYRENTSSLLLAMYSFVAMWLTSRFTDIMLEGLDYSRIAYIISDHYEEISRAIFQELDRGATLLHARGMYSGETRGMIYCVLSSRQVPKLKELTRKIDNKAFVVVTEAREVLGEGFERDLGEFI